VGTIPERTLIALLPLAALAFPDAFWLDTR
jgi:hypothetical protein